MEPNSDLVVKSRPESRNDVIHEDPMELEEAVIVAERKIRKKISKNKSKSKNKKST